MRNIAAACYGYLGAGVEDELDDLIVDADGADGPGIAVAVVDRGLGYTRNTGRCRRNRFAYYSGHGDWTQEVIGMADGNSRWGT